MSWLPSQVQAFAAGFDIRGEVSYCNEPTNDMQLVVDPGIGVCEWTEDDIAELQKILGWESISYAYEHYPDYSRLVMTFSWRKK